MRVLYVTDALAIWGGLERVLVDKANYLATHDGYEVTILTICQGHHPLQFSLEDSVHHVDLDVPFHDQYKYSGFRRLLKLRQIHYDIREKIQFQLKEIQPDIIVCVRIEFVNDILHIKGTIPLVFESHSSFWTSRFEGAGCLRRIHTFWMNLSVRRVDAIVALTEGDASVWRRVNKSVIVIPDMVHLNESETYCDGQSKSVVFVGRLSRQKDIGSLLLIWHDVHQRYPDWQLHVYGEKWDMDDVYYRQLFSPGLGVVVHAPTQQILDEYQKHTVLLLTSKYEPFGIVLPEAMSCGLPVVAFDCPYGPGDIITDGVDGFLVRNRNTSDFADRICQLIESKALRSRMGKAAVQSSQRYRAENIMPMWNRLFTRMGSQKCSTSCPVDKFCPKY